MLFVCVLAESTGFVLFVFSLNPQVLFCVFSLNSQVFFVCVLTESTGGFCLFSLNPQMVFVCVLTESTGVFCLCSHCIHRCLVCTGKRSGENEMECRGNQVPVDIVAQFHAGIGM